MKRPVSFLILFLAVAFSDCKKGDVVEYGIRLKSSHFTWLAFKEQCGNNYEYKAVSSTLNGYKWETVITVKVGKVVERSLLFTKVNYVSSGNPTVTTLDQWTENDTQLGTHDNAADPLTMDEVYTKAGTDWLLKRANTTLHLETNNNGMISYCGYSLNGCYGRCFTGIEISYIKAL